MDSDYHAHNNVSRAARATLLLGVLLLVLAPCAFLPSAILDSTGNRFAQAESPYYRWMAAIFAVAGIALIALGRAIGRAATWAAVITITLSAIALALAALPALGSLVIGDVRLLVGACLVAVMFIALIVRVAAAIPAMREVRRGRGHAFEPKMPEPPPPPPPPPTT
jgi:hypothetical protein